MKKMFLVILALAMCFVTLTNAQSELDPKKYRTTEDVLRQIVDDSTQAIRVEVVPSPTNKTLSPLKRKENNRNLPEILRKLVDPTSNRMKIEFTNFQLFPYDKLVTKWNNAEVKAFRIMVSTTGNDTNDGLTWATAKKTINGALALLPYDLNTYEAYILVAPGTYPPINANFINGRIWFFQMNSSYNSGAGSNGISTWFRNGATTTFTDNAVIVDNTALDAKPATVYLKSNKTAEYSFWSELATPSNAWRFLAEKWMFKCTGASSAATLLDLADVKITAPSLVLDMGLVGFNAAKGGVSGGWLAHLKIIGGTGAGSNVNRSNWWQPALAFYATEKTFTIGCAQESQTVYFETGFAPTNNVSLDYRGITLLWNTWGDPCSALRFNPISGMLFTATDSVASVPELGIRSDANGVYVAYVPAQVNFTDAGTNKRTIKNMTTAVTSTYLTSKIIDNGTDVILPSNLLNEVSTAPTVTQDTQAGFYVKGDKVVLKFNSGGTLKYRYMNLADTTATWTYSTVAP